MKSYRSLLFEEIKTAKIILGNTISVAGKLAEGRGEIDTDSRRQFRTLTN